MRIRNSLRVHFMYEAIQNQNAGLERTVTERTQELEKACAALESANAALKLSQRQTVEQERFRAFGEMAGGVVHDFNNALMTVSGYSEMLLRDPAILQDTATVAECLRTILTAARDASQVVSRLREFYRPREAGEEFAPVMLNKLLEEVAALTQPKWKTQPLAAGRTINLVFELTRVPPALGNGAELREVVTNLIFNAVDAMPNGGNITLRTRREETQAIFEVADSGLGMTPEVRRRCLDPYFSTKGRQGTGLGLSMVFGIIKRHDGVLEIDSTPGKGTTFRVRLPIHSDQSVGPTAAAEIPATTRPLQVMVVDDDPTSREVLANFLQADGHKVTVARSGGEAVLQFLQHRFDLVLTDHGMPGMNGTQLAHFIRKNRADQPVFMVTAFDIDARNPPPGIDLVLHKPLARDLLRRAIADLGHDDE
jgi:signal transduction histidine kinase